MPFGCSCLLSCNRSSARHRVCHFVLISFWAIHPKTATRRPCLTPATWVQLQRNTTHIHAHMHTGNHRLPNLSKFILCWTDTRTSLGVHFHRRCDLNCLSLKLSLIVLTVLPYSNGQGVAGFMSSYSYSRKQGSERPCSPSPAESTHTDTRKHRLVI